jgi:hypothetical protein
MGAHTIVAAHKEILLEVVMKIPLTQIVSTLLASWLVVP